MAACQLAFWPFAFALGGFDGRFPSASPATVQVLT
jgi:hypothetical protein